MNWRRTRRGNDLAFTDTLYNKVVLFAIMFILAFVLVNPIVDDGNIKDKAEIIMQLDWPPGDIDIDIWCEDPNGQIVWYSSRDGRIIHIDRDDRGTNQDDSSLNGEIVSVRKLEPGMYVCNLHYFRRGIRPQGVDPASPVPVTFTVTKLNPRVQHLVRKVISMEVEKQEKTAIRFFVSPDGKTVLVDHNPPFKPLVGTQSGSGSGMDGGEDGGP